MALGYGYDEFGEFTDNGVTPIYQIHNYDCIDADSYIRYFLSVAQKEGANTEQLTRLDAILETMLAPLRNNGYDISYVNYGQTIYDAVAAGDDDEGNINTNLAAMVVSGVVSGYRNGSNACFYLSFPTQYVASGTLVFDIGVATARDISTTNAQTCERVSFAIGDYFENGFLSRPLEMTNALSDALNSLAICGGNTDCFVVRLVSLDEIDFYKGTVGEIDLGVDQFQYTYVYTENNVEYYGMRTVDGFVALQITAQSSLHDTELYIMPTPNSSVLTLLNQTDENLNYAGYTDMYVERYGSYGNLQTNANVANTSNGDVVVVWTMRRFDRRGPQRPLSEHRRLHWNGALAHLSARLHGKHRQRRSDRYERLAPERRKGRRQPNGNFRY